MVDARDGPHPRGGGRGVRGRGKSGGPGRGLTWADFHRHTDRIVEHFAPAVQSALAGIFAAETIQAAIAIAYPDEATKGLLDGAKAVLQAAQRNIQALIDTLRSLYGQAADQGAQEASQAFEPVDVRWDPESTDPSSHLADGVLADILRQADMWIEGLVQTQIDRIGDAIAAGVRAGMPIAQVTANVNQVVNDPKRAYLIAETEYARAMTLAARATYRANGVAKVRWLAQPDCCDRCRANEAVSPIPVADAWPNGNVPVHPSCRCAEAPYVTVPGGD